MGLVLSPLERLNNANTELLFVQRENLWTQLNTYCETKTKHLLKVTENIKLRL